MNCERCGIHVRWPGNWNVNRFRWCDDCRKNVRREQQKTRREAARSAAEAKR